MKEISGRNSRLSHITSVDIRMFYESSKFLKLLVYLVFSVRCGAGG